MRCFLLKVAVAIERERMACAMTMTVTHLNLWIDAVSFSSSLRWLRYKVQIETDIAIVFNLNVQSPHTDRAFAPSIINFEEYCYAHSNTHTKFNSHFFPRQFARRLSNTNEQLKHLFEYNSIFNYPHDNMLDTKSGNFFFLYFEMFCWFWYNHLIPSLTLRV